jgi:hypothetical protein
LPAESGAKGAVNEPSPSAAPSLLKPDAPTFPIARKGRVVMGEVKTSSGGVLSWTVAKQEHVMKNQAVGAVQASGRDSPLPRRLVAPKEGLLIPLADDGARVRAGQKVANVVYVEAFLQTVVKGDKPRAEWLCEVVDSEGEKRAPCKVVTVAPKGSGFFVTATSEPMWIDAAASLQLRLQAP